MCGWLRSTPGSIELVFSHSVYGLRISQCRKHQKLLKEVNSLLKFSSKDNEALLEGTHEHFFQPKDQSQVEIRSKVDTGDEM